jgi:cellulose synthase (UDP-forming)
MVGHAPIPLGSRITFLLRGHSAQATLVRKTLDGFAVHFDETLESRVTMIRTFYTGNYVRSIRNVKATSLGCAILARMFS